MARGDGRGGPSGGRGSSRGGGNSGGRGGGGGRGRGGWGGGNNADTGRNSGRSYGGSRSRDRSRESGQQANQNTGITDRQINAGIGAALGTLFGGVVPGAVIGGLAGYHLSKPNTETPQPEQRRTGASATTKFGGYLESLFGTTGTPLSQIGDDRGGISAPTFQRPTTPTYAPQALGTAQPRKKAKPPLNLNNIGSRSIISGSGRFSLL